MRARLHTRRGATGLLGLLSAVTLLFGVAWASGVPAAASVAGSSAKYTPAARGELDCNGFSPVQKPLRLFNCTDVRGSKKANANTWGGRFYDNGHYIGHDEPDTDFLSSTPGSGGNVSWSLTLGKDPKAAPTATHPGHDVADWFELTPAPWFSMDLCDPNSYPLTACTPQSDSNAPTCLYATCVSGVGGGSAFMEMQFYPPGEAPFPDNLSCDNKHWCAALSIDSLECTAGFQSCNNDCEEPLNFAFIQRDGVPTGPPSPQDADVSTEVPNKQTLLMNPGDQVTFHMWDAPLPGGRGKAFEVYMDDLTTHQSGHMQASAANGFMTTSSADCSGTPFNFQPEYNTAKAGNISPWGAGLEDISTEFETGHWEACTSLADPIANTLDPNDNSPMYNECEGPYENAGPPDGNTPETGDSPCYYAGATHPGYNGPGTSTPPNKLTGCLDSLLQNGDLDFDGSPYWKEWPTGPTPTSRFPSSFVEQFPTTNGSQYGQYFFQTDVALSEYQCGGGDYADASSSAKGCTVPPVGPGHFYPYWSQVQHHGACALEFGNVSSGAGLTDFGQDKQYGKDQFALLGYPQFFGRTYTNPCAT